jgi:prepilin-type N-terminal cleavage/methylation domain-containing protein
MRHGFTLVEMLVAIGIFILIVGALFSLGRFIFRQNVILQTGLLAGQDARQTLGRLAVELRAATTADTGAFAIAQAATSSLIFFSDIDGDGFHDRVRYFTSGATLKRGIIKPTGSPLSYNPASEILTTAVNRLANPNQTIFNYYDKNYAGTSTPMTAPIDFPAIRLVKATVGVYTTQVVIRSLKDNL